MDTVQPCPSCGAAWIDGVTCEDNFHQMGYWELENPPLYEPHHLMVLCYHLQHPHLYSPDGLRNAMQLLADFLATSLTPSDMRQKIKESMGSDKRKFKIKGTTQSFGVYAHPVTWTMTTTDVIAGGVEHYVDNVKAWAQSVYEVLTESGNLTAVENPR